MWWKIILGVVALVVIAFVSLVIKMSITDAKEEVRDIKAASNVLKKHKKKRYLW